MIFNQYQPYQFQPEPIVHLKDQQDQQEQQIQFQPEPLIHQQDQFNDDPLMQQQNQEEETENENPLNYLTIDSFSAIQMHIINSRIQGVLYSHIIWNGKNLYKKADIKMP